MRPAAHAGIESLRRFEIASVRRKGVGRALPKAYLQADLDILQPPTPDTTSKMLAEAEAIKVGPATAPRDLLARGRTCLWRCWNICLPGISKSAGPKYAPCPTVLQAGHDPADFWPAGRGRDPGAHS